MTIDHVFLDHLHAVYAVERFRNEAIVYHIKKHIQVVHTNNQQTPKIFFKKIIFNSRQVVLLQNMLQII